MTFSELRAEVFRRLREESSGPVIWAQADVDGAINEGYAEISDATEWNEKYKTIDILDRQRYYDMRTVVGRGFLMYGPAYNNTTSRWMTPISHRHISEGDSRWEQRLTEPEYVLARSLWWLGYWPIKTAEVGSIKQYYVGLPEELDEDSDEPGIHSSFHYGIIEFALADLFAQLPSADLAWAHWKSYLEYEEKFRQWRDRRAGPPMRRGWDHNRAQP